MNVRLLEGLTLIHRLKKALWRRRATVLAAERHRNDFYDLAWRTAAQHLGAQIVALAPGIHQVSRDGVTTQVFRNYTALDNPVTLAIAGNKPLVYRLLAARRLPIPRYRTFTLATLSEAVTFLERADGNCVVKPAKDTGAGNGVATGIRDRWNLIRAATAAATYGPELLIEHQVAGSVYRLLYLDGVLLDAIERRAPEVIGDGRTTVRELVRRANLSRAVQGPLMSQVLLTIDLDMKRTLARQGLRLGSVPAAGRQVILKTVSNENAGAENISAKEIFCPSVIEAGSQAVAAVGARLAGVDMITLDPSVPLSQTNGVILEVNTTPGYYYHYHKLGAPFAAAVPVLQRLLETPAAGPPPTRTLPLSQQLTSC